jgi:hypothetical protein
VTTWLGDGENANNNILRETTSIDPHHDPGVRQEGIGLLKEAHIFVPEFVSAARRAHAGEATPPCGWITYLELAMDSRAVP